MGDFEFDTRVEKVDEGSNGEVGRYRAQLSEDWRIWGPNGGYLAAIALRAAGAEGTIPRPVSFSCHYLRVANFEEVDIEVVALKRGRSAEFMRVSMRQEGKTFLEAMVCLASERPGLEHQAIEAPQVPGPEELTSPETRRTGEEGPRHAFWMNLEERPLDWQDTHPPEPRDPHFSTWFRYRPTATFDDPFVDAARSLLLIDTMGWPAAWRLHVPEDYYAPSLDLAASFHAAAPDSEWLHLEAQSPIARDGLINASVRTFAPDGRLLASGGQQLVCMSSKGYAG